MKQIIVIILGFCALLYVGTGYAATSIISYNDKLTGGAVIKVSYPKGAFYAADKAIKKHIQSEIQHFYKQQSIQHTYTGGEHNALTVLCKVVSDSSDYYSVLCDHQSFVYGIRGSRVKTFLYDVKKRSSIGLSQLIPSYKLPFLLTNLKRYYINTTQAVTPEERDRIERGLSDGYDSLKQITVQVSGSQIHSIQLYFNPFQISLPEKGIHRVKLSYPGVKIMR